ncbi:MAG: hypothetical protein AAFX05_15135, partial [Planctomycetota bacterium]
LIGFSVFSTLSAGCAARTATSDRVVPPPPATEYRTAAGLLRDIHPAVLYAASVNQMAVIDREDEAGNIIRYTLMTVGDEPVSLRITIRDDALGEITASVGRFGDADRETSLIRDFTARVNELQSGDGVAPATY